MWCRTACHQQIRNVTYHCADLVDTNKNKEIERNKMCLVLLAGKSDALKTDYDNLHDNAPMITVEPMFHPP